MQENHRGSNQLRSLLLFDPGRGRALRGQVQPQGFDWWKRDDNPASRLPAGRNSSTTAASIKEEKAVGTQEQGGPARSRPQRPSATENDYQGSLTDDGCPI